MSDSSEQPEAKQPASDEFDVSLAELVRQRAAFLRDHLRAVSDPFAAKLRRADGPDREIVLRSVERVLEDAGQVDPDTLEEWFHDVEAALNSMAAEHDWRPQHSFGRAERYLRGAIAAVQHLDPKTVGATSADAAGLHPGLLGAVSGRRLDNVAGANGDENSADPPGHAWFEVVRDGSHADQIAAWLHNVRRTAFRRLDLAVALFKLHQAHNAMTADDPIQLSDRLRRPLENLVREGVLSKSKEGRSMVYRPTPNGPANYLERNAVA